MKARNSNKLHMYMSIRDVLNNHQAVWDQTPAFVEAVNQLKQTIALIEETNAFQNKIITGVAITKQKLKTNLLDNAFVVAKATYAYATVIDDQELKENVHFSRSSLNKSRDTLILAKCQVIFNTVAPIVATLVDYGLNQATVDKLEDALASYEARISAPRSAIVDRKNATAQLQALIKQTDAIVHDKLDNLLELFKLNHSSFVGKFQSARIIIDLGANGTHIKGRLFDTANQKSMADALVQMQLLTFVDGVEVVADSEGIEGIEVELPEILKTTTDSDGNFEVKNLKVGMYRVTFSKSGYMLQGIEKADIRRGKTLHVGSVGLERARRLPPQMSDQ